MGIFLTVNYKVISNDTEHDKFVKNPAVGTFGAFDLTNTSLKIRTSPLCIQNKNIIHNSPQQSIMAHWITYAELSFALTWEFYFFE